MTGMLTSEILDRLPPQDADAERNLLGSVLLQPALLDDLGSVVRPSDFYSDAHTRLWCHLLAMRDEGAGLDVTTIRARLLKAGEFEAVGGAAYLAELLHRVPVAAHAKYYAAIMLRHAKARDIIHAATSALRDAWDVTVDPSETLNRAEASLAAIHTGEFLGEPRAAADIAVDALQRIETVKQRKHAAGVLTGFWRFDNNIGGLFPGELVILAARPGIGKTSLACQTVHHVALNRGLAYLASLEMGQLELADRMICTLGGVSSRQIRTGNIRDEDYRLLARGAAEFGKANLLIHDRPSLAVADIRRACRRLVRQGLCLVVVDYLQLLTAPDKRLKRYEQIGQLTKELKATARELKVPVLCLCQLNREMEREKRRPRLSDLRDSGEIEQDSDVVLFLHRDPPKKGESPKTETELIVAKNRNGETGAFRLEWEAKYTRYVEATPENYESAFDKFSGEED